MSDLIRETIEGTTLTLSLQFNPENAVTEEAMHALLDVLQKYRDSSVRTILLTSTRPGFFSNGFDPALWLDRDEKFLKRTAATVNAILEIFFFYPIPVIAVINGHCMAVATFFAAFSDYRYMIDGHGYRIGLPEARVGAFIPSFPFFYLKELIGINHATDMVYQARLLKPVEARDIGLINEIFDSDEAAFARANRMAKRIAGLPIEGTRALKQCTRETYRPLFEAVRSFDEEIIVGLAQTPNTQEGFRSILEKRRPVFQ
ncbi:MAG: enoyl-CoA hydratase/isomerase family protein [Leptospiraceae bacterium]|nr:enoyl-CoA hydratase/isomerase family protein [Leptospiraceae bacterium]